jgi:hypothetical protein
VKITFERLAVAVLVAGFAIGTVTHTLQLVTRGWVVFDAVPKWMNIYWTSLTFLDPLAAVLLLTSRRAGLALGLSIMVSDVAINSYALYGLNSPIAIWALQSQTLFGGFLLGAVGYLWHRQPDI